MIVYIKQRFVSEWELFRHLLSSVVPSYLHYATVIVYHCSGIDQSNNMVELLAEEKTIMQLFQLTEILH